MTPRRTDRETGLPDAHSRALRAIAALCWWSLLLLHLWLLLAADGAGERSAGARAGLLLASAFFGLQLLRPRFLRLRSPRRELLLYALLAAFVHQDVRTAVLEGATSPRALEATTAAMVIAAAAIVAGRRLRSAEAPLERIPVPARRGEPVRRILPKRTARRLPLLARPPPRIA